eukprot:642231-Rhodomonas_salina.5
MPWFGSDVPCAGMPWYDCDATCIGTPWFVSDAPGPGTPWFVSDAPSGLDPDFPCAVAGGRFAPPRKGGMWPLPPLSLANRIAAAAICVAVRRSGPHCSSGVMWRGSARTCTTTLPRSM